MVTIRYAVMMVLLISAFSSQASFIQIEKINLYLPTPNNDLAEVWHNYSASSLSPENIGAASMLYVGSTYNNTLFKMTIDLLNKHSFEFQLYAGLDAGRGAEVFANGLRMTDRNENLWWRRNWTHKHVLSLENLSFNAGLNTLVIYWAENFNSGGNSFEFSLDNGERMALSHNNLRKSLTRVPEPQGIVLVVFGFVFMMRRTLNKCIC